MNIFDFNPFQSVDISFSGIMGFWSDLFSFIFSEFGMLLNSVTDMIGGIINLQNIVDGMISGIENNDINGLPVLEAIGVYRYLVGDIVFNFTYLSLLFGIGFTIVKLILLFKKIIGEFFDTGGTSILRKLFGNFFSLKV